MADGWQGSAAQRAVEMHFGTVSEVRLVSRSNNAVWRVVAGGAVLAVKEVRDATADPVAEWDLLTRIGAHPRFRPILMVQPGAGCNPPVAVSPYLDGESLDAVLQTRPTDQVPGALWADQLAESFAALGDLHVQGFGRPRAGRGDMFAAWPDFLCWYLDRQGRKAPRIASLRFELLRSVVAGLDDRLRREVRHPTLVSGDVNLRNFLVDTKGNLVCLHTPILWHADPAVPFGEAGVHLDHTTIGNVIWEHCGLPKYRLHLYAAFSAYVILAYVERFSPEPLEVAKTWGGTRPLLEILDEHLAWLGDRA